MTENFNILVNKLNSFKLRYYLFKLVKGIILVFFVLLSLYIAFSLVEYFVYLPSEYRKILFFAFAVFGFLLFAQFIGIPLLKLAHILKPIDTKSTSLLIQNNFSDIKDKLLNVIELAAINDKQYSNEIILASIDQKIEELKWYDFNDAVQFKNLKYIFFYFIISITVGLGIFAVNKSIFTESAQRIIHYNQVFVKPAPYSFGLLTTDLQAKKGDPFTIKVSCEGDEIPQFVYINIDGNNYLMKNSSAGVFEFQIASVINPVNFYFTDLKYNSDKYYLELLPKPGITQFNVVVYPPTYTGLQNQELSNIGDLQVPNGTKIEWQFSGIDIDSLYLLMSDSIKLDAEVDQNRFVVDSKFYNSTYYDIFIQNKVTEPELALSYSIDVVPDLFPEIDIVQVKDSFQLTQYFFKGVIGDDYGFSDLEFHYNVDNSDSAIAIPFTKSLTDQEFYFSFDFNDLPEHKGIITYYFSVTDNDVVNNYKTTTSDSYLFEFPDREQIAENESEQFENLQNRLEESREMAKDIQSDLDNLRLKNMDTNVSDWEKSQMVNDIMSKQSRLEQLYDQIKQDNENLNNYLNSFNKQSEEILEKQKQIEELLNEVFTDELRELLEEFNKLAEEFDSGKLNQLYDEMDLTYEDLQEQLDRNLEMLRKMKVEEDLQSIIDKLNEVADRQEELSQEINGENSSEETIDRSGQNQQDAEGQENEQNEKGDREEQLSQESGEQNNFEDAKERLEEFQEEIERTEEELNEILKQNDELERPINFDDFDEDYDEIERSFEENKNELDNQNREKSGEGIRNSSEQLRNMTFAMQQMLDQSTMQQSMENIENLRQILSNLILLSFNQEEILNNLTGLDAGDPMLIELNQEQKRIIDQSIVVKDSLYALARRTPQINSMVNNELLSMQSNLETSAGLMEEGMFPNARSSQQFVITSLNNLALMLNEALENIEDQMQNADARSGEQQNGNSRQNLNLLRDASENIREQLERMIEQMRNGNSQQMNQQMGQSLMQHEMMQQMLRELMNNGSVGSGAREMLQQIDEMLEQNRRELMNKSINSQTIERQNLITTRLLEAEQAEQERDFEEKRESQSAEDFFSNPVKFFEYKEPENYSIEYLNKNSHKLNNFYNYKYKQYLNNIENQE